MAAADSSPDLRATDRAPSRPVLEDLSVLIPTLGRPLLERCLLTIQAGSAWPARVIVIDQGDNPAVEAWLRELEESGIPTHHVRSSQRGVAAARNRGIERVETRFFAVTDDDCMVAEDWLEKMAACLRENPEAIVTGRVLPPEGGLAPSTITDEESTIYRRPQIRGEPLYPGNMGLASRTAQRIGAFDESPLLLYSEDNDWSYRALRSGIAIRYAPEVAVTHLDWRDSDQMAVVYRKYESALGAFYGKYLRRADAFIALRALRDLLRGPVRWLRGRLRGDEDMVVRGRASTLYLLPGIWAGLRWKARR